MKLHLSFALCLLFSISSFAQELSSDFKSALKGDDAVSFEKLVNEKNINACFSVSESSYNLLALCIKLDAKNCFESLLRQKANLETSCSGKTALMYAAKYGKLEMVKVLIGYGADKNASNEGKTAFDYAVRYEHKDIENYLLSLK